MTNHQKVQSVLKANELGVLSTASLEGKPQSAVMAYAVKEDDHLIMFTGPSTRKIKNINQNQQVSVVVGGFKDDPCVQLDGQIKVLEGLLAEQAKEYVLAVYPDWQSYFSPNSVWLEVTPAWARYTDYSQDPADIFEETDFNGQA